MKKLLLTPGPTNIPEKYLKIFSEDIIHHRTPKFREILKENNNNLKKIFKTKNDIYVLTASGTGAMEASVVNFFSKDDKVIIINTGYFGKRFKKIAQIYGLNVISLDYDFGETYNIEEIKNILSLNKDIKGIFVTHSETSVGILNNIKKLGELTKNSDILLVVDTISGLVVNEFEFDDWNVDVAIAGSQKAFLIPPGLSFIAMSDKARKISNNSNLPKYYFSIRQYEKYFIEESETPYTPAISLILALNESLKDLLAKGIDKVINEKMKLRKYIETRALNLGFNLLVENEMNRTNTLVSIYRDDICIKNIISNLENIGYTVTGGKGKYANSLMRIGILGDISINDINNFFEALEIELKKELK